LKKKKSRERVFLNPPSAPFEENMRETNKLTRTRIGIGGKKKGGGDLLRVP